jgi:hypothetical protein
VRDVKPCFTSEMQRDVSPLFGGLGGFCRNSACPQVHSVVPELCIALYILSMRTQCASVEHTFTNNVYGASAHDLNIFTSNC